MNSVVELLIAGTGLSFARFFVLCFVSFLGSLIAGALGLGGGGAGIGDDGEYVAADGVGAAPRCRAIGL